MRSLPLALLLAVPALAQTWAVEFQETFTNQVIDVRQLPTGEVALLRTVGFTAYHVTLLDANGALLWDQRYWGGDAYGIGVAPDGRIAVAGWDWPEAHSEVLLPTGAFSFTVQGTSHGGVNENSLNTACATADGGWVFVGSNTDDSCDFDLLVRRLDAAGNLLWDRIVGDTNFLMDLPGYDVVELPDLSLLVLGRKYPNVYLMRFSSTGSLLWKKSFATGSGLRPQFDLAPSGDYVFHVGGNWGASTLQNDEDFHVLATRTSGGALWARRYGGDGLDVAADVVATPDGGCLVVGSTSSFANAKKDIWLVRLDPLGDIVWQRSYGGSEHDEALSVDLSASGGFLVAGASQADLNGDWRGLVMKVDANGNLAGCQGAPTWAVPVDVNISEHDPFGAALDQADSLVHSVISSPDAATVQPAACLGGALGTRYCTPGVPNSSGASAAMWVAGSDLLADDLLRLVAEDLPANQFGYFVTGMGNGTTIPPGSQGVLCLVGSSLHRYAARALNTGAAGTFGIEADVNAIPNHGAIQPGETWNFQAWHRDLNPGPTSNFSDAVGVAFQ